MTALDPSIGNENMAIGHGRKDIIERLGKVNMMLHREEYVVVHFNEDALVRDLSELVPPVCWRP